RDKSADPQMTPRALYERPPPEKRPIRIVAEMQAARLVRATESERQLEEVMVDFWFNHFNVHAAKGEVKWYLTSYERDVIRPHALGRFGDLLRGTATHPAMLFYLDNWLSMRPDFTLRFGPNRGKRAGLNETYARELMALHTRGVERVAATFRATEGDIKAMLRALVASPEFWAPEARRAKIKKPFEYVASAVRAVGGHVDARAGFALARYAAEMGEGLYGAQPPTG